MRKSDEVSLPFPLKGISVVGQKVAQPPGTCIDSQNVRITDRLESRARGGQRQGLLKHTANAAVVNARIQDINEVVYVANTAPSTGSIGVRQMIQVAVCNGNVYTFNTTGFTLATGGTGALNNASPFVFSDGLFGKLYFADGVNYKVFTASNSTVNTWTPTAGSLPGTASICPRLICAWRGRIVISGLRTDAHNWFMSKVGDPLDWDYAPVAVTEMQAAQGGVGYVGKLGDIINCLIPYNDDTILFGCDKSIWRMAGDPMAGGKLDLVTDAAGIAFGKPWCKNKAGDVFFYSTNGRVYQTPQDGKPYEISMEIHPLIVNTNLNTSVIRMLYDDREDGFHMFVTPLTNGSATHWFFDTKSAGWFKNVMGSNSYNPVAVHRLQGDASTERLTLIGGEDGFIRYFANNTYADDGTNTTSYVVLGPIVSEAGRYPHVLREIQGILDTGSGGILYEIVTGDSPDAAIASIANSFVGDGTITNGRSYAFQPHDRSFYTYIKIGATTNTNWAIEEIRAKLSVIVSSKGRSI